MLDFWLLAFALTAVALLVLIWPLLRNRSSQTQGRVAESAASLAVFRDQKRQLESEFAAGTLTETERDASLTELVERLHAEVTEAPAPPAAGAGAPSRKLRAGLAVLLVVLVPLAASVIYYQLGRPEALALTSGDRKQMVEMVERLAERLRSRPNNPEGWVLLAGSYSTLGRFPDAAKAYERAVTLIPDNADLLVDYADALAMVHGRTLAGKPRELIERALTLDPKNKKALALAATAELDAQNLPESLAYWTRLRAELPADSEDVRQIDEFITEIQGELAKRASVGDRFGPPGKVGKSPSPSVAQGGTSTPGPPFAGTSAENAPRSQASGAVSASGAAPRAGGAISGSVSIKPELASRVSITDTVFIFARAVTGPRMPLAVLRVPAKELPRQFTLDDSMAMSPAMKISSASDVVIEARISKSGNATPQPGDLSGKSGSVKPGASGVLITIDQILP